MSAPAAPQIPPRPARLQEAAEAQNAAQLPQIPPRPLPKRVDRSVSPMNYPPSPLNEPYGLTKTKSREPIPRPPSVSHMPLVGEEGQEYGNIQYRPVDPVSALGADAAAQTRIVDKDLHLHAPKPSLPKASATAQVQAVTRTDSSSAAVLGIGRPPSQEGHHTGYVRSRASFSRPDSAASGDRRRSVYDDEQGPAEIGLRVPINPLLGDVQAPSPGPLSPHHTGQSPAGDKRRHSRTRSGREVFLPPGSYGLHGHGVPSSDKFEKDWYAKHPEQLEHEEGQGHGVYESIGSGRGAFALSSDDLNKIVRDTASRGHGFGTTGNVVSYPDEQIGYAVTEQITSRNQTPSLGLHKTHSSVVQPAQESPLRKASLPGGDAFNPAVHRGSDSTIEEMHIDDPQRKYNKITGGQESMNETEPAKPYLTHPTTDEDGLVDEHGYSAPILAEDEVAKEVGADHMHPAVNPRSDRRASSYEDYHRSDSNPPSRPSSRPGSIYGLHSASHSLTRFISHHDDREHLHTPLEDVAEYEPLFPEDDPTIKRPSTADRFKQRPDFIRHKFPSQDIWEDTPSSAMYEATVSTPDLAPQGPKDEVEDRTSTFESPESERARKGEPSEEEKKKLVPVEQRLAQSKFLPHLRDDMPTSSRPQMQNRFPSRDVWEDTPDSQHLVTTVGGEEEEDDDDVGPLDEKPVVPTRPEKSRLGDGASSAQIAPSVVPDIPARPAKNVHAVPPLDAKLTDTTALPANASPTEERKVPSLPSRPKPQVPARPAKKAEPNTLTKVTSASSQESADTITGASVPKAKPQVPARPQPSGKFASLKSNFMNDLNQKLGLGPPKEKEREPEPEPEEAKPLEDARKGRARGPQRRAPAKSPSSAPQTLGFAISAPRSLWDIDENGVLNIGVAQAKSNMSEDKIKQMDHATITDTPLPPTLDTSTKAGLEDMARPDDGPAPMAPSLATNTAGEYVDPKTSGVSVISQKTVADTVSEEPLERDHANPNTDAIPVSRQSTATDIEPRKLEKVVADEPLPISSEARADSMPGAFE